MEAREYLKKRFRPDFVSLPLEREWVFSLEDLVDCLESYHQAKSKEESVSDVSLDVMASKTCPPDYLKKKARIEYLRYGYKVGYKAAFGKEGEG